MLGNLAQTFIVRSDRVKNATVLFITSVDLNFKSVPIEGNNNSGFNNPGVTVSLCKTEISSSGDSIPNLGKILIGASRTKSSSIITPNEWVNFKFNGPIPIVPDVAYAIVLSFDGDANFILNAKTSSGVSTTGVTAYQDGKLFVNSEGELKVHSETDLAFRIYCAKFDTSNSGAELEVLNDSLEFLVISNIDTDLTNSPFLGDEFVIDGSASSQTGTISFNHESNFLIGSGTAFNTVLIPGSRIVLSEANSLITASTKDVVVVNNVINSTALYITSKPSANVVDGFYYHTPTGKFFSFNLQTKTMVLWDSTAANSTYKFTVGDSLLGIDSNTTFKIEEVANYRVNKFNADFGIFTPPQTGSEIKIALANTSYVWNEDNFLKIIPKANNIYSITAGIIASRSNEVVNTTNLYDSGVSANTSFRYKSFVARAALTTENEFTSPHWKSDLARLILYQNFINNDLTGETGRYGNCESKYLNKVVTLAEGLEAEDLRVFITLTKPIGTDIQPFAKIAHSSDIGSFEDHVWSPLELKNTILINKVTADVSQTGKTKEVIELEYGFGTKLEAYGDLLVLASGAQVFATTEGGNNVVTLTENPANTLPTELVANDTIEIYNPGFPDIHWITVVNSVINSTAITTITPAPSGSVTDGSGNFIIKVQEAYKFSAFNNIFNDNVVRYFSKSTLGVYDEFKSFDVKIDLLSDDDSKEPILFDVRGLAVSS